jgi:hypothetical protein
VEQYARLVERRPPADTHRVNWSRTFAAAAVALLILTACGGPERPASARWLAPSAGASASTTASPTPAARSPSPAALVVPAGVVAGIAVFDRRTATFATQLHVTTRFRSASLVKLLIALDYLWNRGPGYAVPAADRSLLDIMLRSSDDNAASHFWDADGKDGIVTRMAARLGLQNTTPPSAQNRTGWGSTALSPADLVRIYRYLLDSAPAAVRDLVMGDLHQSTRCGTDHYDQSFGIPSAFGRPWAAKQGWYGFGDTPAQPCTAAAAASAAPGAAGPRRDPGIVDVDLLSGAVLHTTGTVGPADRTIVVVLTQYPAGASFANAAATVTGLARALPVPVG